MPIISPPAPVHNPGSAPKAADPGAGYQAMVTADVVDYYVSLLILQYGGQANAVATMRAVLGSLLQDQIVTQVRDAFDLLTAVGKQLTILGTYRGAQRNVYGVNITRQWWSLVPYDDVAPDSYLGLAMYGDADPTWYSMFYADLEALLYTLNDHELRQLIQLRAVMHRSDLSLASLDNILYTYFGSYVTLADNGDMTMTLTHHATDPSNLWNIAKNSSSLPHPAGVALTIVEAA